MSWFTRVFGTPSTPDDLKRYNDKMREDWLRWEAQHAAERKFYPNPVPLDYDPLNKT